MTEMLRKPETLLMAEILATGVELSREGVVHVFCDYSGHVNVFACTVHRMDTDYQNIKNEPELYKKNVDCDSADHFGGLSEILAYLRETEVTHWKAQKNEENEHAQ